MKAGSEKVVLCNNHFVVGGVKHTSEGDFLYWKKGVDRECPGSGLGKNIERV